MKILRKKNGITLIALVITIILLLILAGITITQLTGSGLFEKAKIAKEESIKAQIKEEISLELIDIVTEYETKEKNITNTIIKEELENRISEIQVLEDLTVIYKGYKYKIDENFNVSIIDGNENNSINIDIDKKVGTSYITINVQANSTEGNIVKYEYIIDGVTYTSDKTVYTIENLEPESTHTIKVVAIDDKDNSKPSNVINVKTEPRTYLYKEGEEYTELTGGWNVGFLNGTDSSVGNAKKHDNYIEVQTWGWWCGFGCSTQNAIDVTEYTKIKTDLFDCSWTDTSCGGLEQAAIGCGDSLAIFYRDEIYKDDIKLDISSLSGNNNIRVLIGNGANAKIRSIWLEK